MKPLALLAAVALAVAAQVAAAQTPPPAAPPAAPAPMARTIVRGVVAQASDTALVITGRDGKTVNVNLAPNWTVAVLKPIPVAQSSRAASSAPPRCRRPTAPASRSKCTSSHRA